MMLIYYKTWRYQCLIKQVKSPSICSRVPETGSDPPFGSGRESGRDNLCLLFVRLSSLMHIPLGENLLHFFPVVPSRLELALHVPLL